MLYYFEICDVCFVPYCIGSLQFALTTILADVRQNLSPTYIAGIGLFLFCLNEITHLRLFSTAQSPVIWCERISISVYVALHLFAMNSKLYPGQPDLF